MLNVFELNRQRDEKEVRKYETYRKILEKVHFKIEQNSKKGISFCFYNLPNYLPGLPAYNILKCAEYVIERLRKLGIIVLYFDPNTIYATWEHIPSSLKNPVVKKLESEIITNPYKDYSQLIHQLSFPEHNQNTPMLQYFTQDKVYNDTSSIYSSYSVQNTNNNQTAVNQMNNGNPYFFNTIPANSRPYSLTYSNELNNI
jgi:hypothetical protein